MSPGRHGFSCNANRLQSEALSHAKQSGRLVPHRKGRCWTTGFCYRRLVVPAAGLKLEPRSCEEVQIQIRRALRIRKKTGVDAPPPPPPEPGVLPELEELLLEEDDELDDDEEELEELEELLPEPDEELELLDEEDDDDEEELEDEEEDDEELDPDCDALISMVVTV